MKLARPVLEAGGRMSGSEVWYLLFASRSTPPHQPHTSTPTPSEPAKSNSKVASVKQLEPTMTRLSSLPTLTSCSVESLLSIPLQFIFRETTGNGNGTTARNHRSFIFSKNECATLLRVNMVSYNIKSQYN